MKVLNAWRTTQDQELNGQLERHSNVFKQKPTEMKTMMMMRVLHQMQQGEQIQVSKVKVGVVYK